MSALRWVLPLIARRRTALVGAVMSSLLHQVGVLALAVLSAFFLGRALFAEDFAAGWSPMLAVIAALVLAVAICAWWESFVSHDLAYALLAELRSEAYGELVRSSPSRTAGRSGSDDAAAVMSDVETLEWLFAHTIAQMISSSVVLGIGGVLSALISPQLIGIWLGAAGVLAVAPWAMSRWGIAQGRRARDSAAHVHALLVETVQGIGDLAAAGALERRLRRIEDADREHARRRLCSDARASVESSLSEAVVGAAGILAVLIMAASIRHGRIDPELVAVAMVLAIGTLAPAAQIAALLKGIGSLVAAAARVKCLFTAIDSAPAPPEPVSEFGPGQPKSLEFRDVRFGYEPERPVLDGVTFRVERGESLAIAGASGAGKSTIAALATRIWDPDAGQVAIGDVPLHLLEDSLLRRTVTGVPQETHLLRGTIESNIRLARPDAPAGAVTDSADAARLRDPEAGLPSGLATRVGERGSGLSGGQRARVSFARAFVTEAPFVVLDESAAHLDPRSEDELAAALRARPGGAALVIAHRPRTIAACDRVLVLEGGRIVECGAPRELLADPDSRLCALLRREHPSRAETAEG